LQYTILSFGIARDIIGHQHLVWDTDQQLTVGALKAVLLERYPRFGDLRSLAIAVNAEYSTDDTYTLQPGDEIALIPPVSGG
jgi:sulfur-carrier protein